MNQKIGTRATYNLVPNPRAINREKQGWVARRQTIVSLDQTLAKRGTRSYSINDSTV